MRNLLPLFSLLVLAITMPVSKHKAMEYLHKFGYLRPQQLSVDGGFNEAVDRAIEIRNAIKKFQEMAGIHMTGDLDVPTMEKMSRPRCGVVDTYALNTNRDGDNEPKWSRTNLTFSIDNFWSGMTQSEIRTTIHDAFKVWSAVTPLTFREVYYSNADIKIRFARGQHCNADPFDGEGGTLAHASIPEIGQLHFDADENWMRMNAHNHPVNTHIDLLYVAIHEIGHIIGLKHVTNPASVMAAMYINPQDAYGNYVAPRLDSGVIGNAQRLYGAARSPAGRGSPPREEPTYPRPQPRMPQHCLRHIVAVASIPRNRLLVFPDSRHVMTINSSNKIIIGKDPIIQVFDFGPFDVSAVIYSASDSMILMFEDNMVYGYKLNVEENTVSHVFGYPKMMPTLFAGEFFWKTKAAFIIPNGRRILISETNKVAIYNEHNNSIKIMAGSIRDSFPNIPEDVVGFAKVNHGTHLGFTSTHVFEYDFGTNSVTNLGKLHSYMGC